jgi:hypothetical protein
MKKIALVLAAVIGMTSVAHADWYGHRRYQWGNHSQYHRDDHSGDWVGPLVGGMIIGGIIGSMSQPRSYSPPVYDDYQPQLVCYRRYVGTDYYGYPIYRRYCEEQ